MPASITKKQRSEIEVAYLADWDHRFFGIADGMVTRIRVGAVVPDANGRFEVNVPDFDKQTNLGDGEFQFILRQRVTSNTITLLKPSSADTVKVSPSYPSVVFFKAEKQ